MDKRKGFTCDETSKKEFINATTKYWEENAPQFSLQWYGVNNNEGTTDFTLVQLGKESDESRLDLGMTASYEGITITYIFELKERNYTSEEYGAKPNGEGWFFNIEKSDVLKKAASKGFVPIYVNLYPDDIIRIWNINKVTRERNGVFETITKPINKYYVKESEKILQNRYHLMNNEGVTYKRW